MRFIADEFIAGGIWGYIEGTCAVDPFSGCVVPISIDWPKACFCRVNCHCGEPIELTAEQRFSISEELRLAMEEVDPAGNRGFVLVRSRVFA